jgi:hypothetical protein
MSEATGFFSTEVSVKVEIAKLEKCTDEYQTYPPIVKFLTYSEKNRYFF